MILDREVILNKLAELSPSSDLSVARAFLSSPDVVELDPPVAGQLADDHVVLPKDIVRTWDVRCENAVRKGFKLPGCADFVRKLKSIPDTTELINMVLKNDGTTGFFWFNRKSHELMGFVIADRVEVHK